MHGVPRATFDLHILIAANPENAQRLLDAFLDANLGTATLIKSEELLANEITIFQDRVRIDVQTRTPGITFEAAWSQREAIEYLGLRINLVSKIDLISSKRAAGRPVDLEDVYLLTLDDLGANSGEAA